MEGIHSRAE
jgi:hypothetical protein